MKTSVATVFAAGVMAAGLAASPAGAITIVTTLNPAVQVGAPYAGQFDLSAYLTQGGDSYEITGAKITATGFSAPQVSVTQGAISDPQFVSQVQRVVVPAHDETQVVCNPFCFPQTVHVPATFATDTFYNEFQDINVTDATSDVMRVDVGQGVGVGGVATHIFQVGGYLPVGGAFVIGGDQATGLQFATLQQRTITNENYGALSAVGVLTASDLLTLNGSGLLDFTVDAPVGQFGLQSVQVDFDLLKLPSGVPEPSAWALMIVGLGGVGGALRRRRAGRARIELA